MSTTGRAINLSIGFSRAIESAPDTQEAACSAWATPLSPGNQIPGRAARVKKKREPFPGLALASPTSLMSPYNIHVPVREYEPDSLSEPAGPGARRHPPDLLPTVEGTPQDRLTRVQVLFTRNPSPLQSSKFSFEYLLLPPRSALKAVPRRLTPDASSRPPRPPTHLGPRTRPDGPVSVARLSAIHFQG
jgi:hypothetical protein